MDEPAKKTISIRLDFPVFLNACDLAQAEDRSFNNWVTRAVEAAILRAKMNHPSGFASGGAIQPNTFIENTDETRPSWWLGEAAPMRETNRTVEPSPEQTAARAKPVELMEKLEGAVEKARNERKWAGSHRDVVAAFTRLGSGDRLRLLDKVGIPRSVITTTVQHKQARAVADFVVETEKAEAFVAAAARIHLDSVEPDVQPILKKGGKK